MFLKAHASDNNANTLNTSIKLFFDLEIFLKDVKYSSGSDSIAVNTNSDTNKSLSNLLLTIVLVFKLMIIFVLYIISIIPFIFFKTSNLTKPYTYVKKDKGL